MSLFFSPPRSTVRGRSCAPMLRNLRRRCRPESAQWVTEPARRITYFAARDGNRSLRGALCILCRTQMGHPRGPLPSAQCELYAVSDCKGACAVHAFDEMRPRPAYRVRHERGPGRTVDLTFACRCGHVALHNPAERRPRAPGAILIPCADARSSHRQLEFTACPLIEGRRKSALPRYRRPGLATCMTALTLLYRPADDRAHHPQS